MNRKQLLSKAFQRGHLLTVKNKFYRDWIKKFIVDETKADVGARGDITSNAVLKDGEKVKGYIYSRSDGVLAGIEEVSLLFHDAKVNVKQLRKDGDRIKNGSKLLILYGNEKEILRIERPILDVLSRMSGIATLTRNLVMEIGNKVPIASTRKVEWRYLDKKAIYVGGGLTHRLALWESILIKDNHLDALRKKKVKDAIGIALERAWKHKKKTNFIEIEVVNEKQAIRAASKFKELQSKANNLPCLIMLDNMKPAEIIRIIKKLKNKKLYEHVLIEASGGIKPDNVKEYSRTGVDVLSLGYLTTSLKSLDIKLRI